MDRAKQVATSLCVGCLFVFVFGLERSLSFGQFILACLGFVAVNLVVAGVLDARKSTLDSR